jgi:hypothetical protein
VVLHPVAGPRDDTKWRFIPTCAWCRIDTQFIWKICNRHQGTQERAELIDQITLICQNINNLDDNNRLLWILNNENSIILKTLCQYMIKTGFK